MSLKKIIINKTMAAFAVIFTAFASTSAFAQEELPLRLNL
jgi:hypothetical protein